MNRKMLSEKKICHVQNLSCAALGYKFLIVFLQFRISIMGFHELTFCIFTSSDILARCTKISLFNPESVCECVCARALNTLFPVWTCIHLQIHCPHLTLCSIQSPFINNTVIKCALYIYFVLRVNLHVLVFKLKSVISCSNSTWVNRKV